MFDRSKCDLCGDCLVRCQYIDYDRDRAIKEFTALTEGRYADILKECVTCVACNEYCSEGANPYDLILQLQEKTGALAIPDKMRAWVDSSVHMPSEIIKGDPDKPFLSICLAEPMLPEGLLKSKMFEDLTMVKGEEYFCYVVYLHLALESVAKANAQKFVDKLAGLGAKEIIFLHDECYAMLTNIGLDYGLQVPFKPVHIVEYALNYLKDNKSSITRLGKKIAYQRPCSSRWTLGEDPLLDEVFELIGVDRVARNYDREEALCCTFPFTRLKPELTKKVRDMNLADAKEHNAEAMIFLCPWCLAMLGKDCQERGMVPIYFVDLCRMALGEKPFPV